MSFAHITDFYKTMNLKQAYPAHPHEISSGSIASASLPQPPIPKRKQSQRVYLKDRPQSIYQLRLSEIQMLNQQLDNYKRWELSYGSNQPAPSIPLYHRNPIRSQENHNSVQQHRVTPESIETVVRAGEQFRDQILAASDIRSEEEKQKFNILKHIEALARERQSLLSQLANQKAKSSVLQQELFLCKDGSAKQLLKIEALRNDLLGEIQGLKANCSKLESALQQARSQVAVIPIYEQRCLEKESTVSLLSQELSQARSELAYFAEKSKYFQNNHTVLNENFNNLYMNNLSISSELKELQRRHSISEERLQQMNKKIMAVREEKEKILNDIILEIKEIIVKKRGELKQTSTESLENEEKLMVFLADLKNLIKQQQNRSVSLQKQIDNKQNIILLEKSISSNLKISINNLEENWKKREESWAKEISNINKEFTARILELTGKNLSSKEEANKLEESLKTIELQMRSATIRQLELKSRLEAQIKQSQMKEQVIKALKNELQHFKLTQSLNKNSITDFQRKLSTSLTVQEQLTMSTRANLEQKHSKIRELEEKLANSRDELVRYEVNLDALKLAVARSVEEHEQLRSQLAKSASAYQQLELAFVNQAAELGRIQQEAALKERIIDRYSKVTEEMRRQIQSNQKDIADMKNKCSTLAEQNDFLRAQSFKLQQDSKKVLASYEAKQRENLSLQAKTLQLENSLKSYAARNLEMDSLIENFKQKLRTKERQTLTAEMALKQATQHLAREREEDIARIISENSQKIEAINSEWAALENKYKQIIAQNESSIESMKNSLEILSSEKSQAELKIAEQRQTTNKFEISLIQHAQNLAKTHSMLIQAKEKSKKEAEEHLHQRNYLNQIIQQLRSECQQHKNQKTKQTTFFRDTQKKRQEELMVKQQTLVEISQLLSNQRAKNQTLELEKNLLVKSLKQVQQTLSSQLEVELALKNQTQQQQLSQKQEKITAITAQKNSLQRQVDSLRLKINEHQLMLSKLQTILQKNNEVYKSEVEFLKKSNIQLQIERNTLLQSSQGRSQVLPSISRLELKNSFLEQTLARTLNEVESMQALFGEVKQERDQLIKKYILLSNEISSLKSQRSGLQNELDAFAQYFSRISALYTQIGRHFYNIAHLSQSTSFRVIHSIVPVQEQPQQEK